MGKIVTLAEALEAPTTWTLEGEGCTQSLLGNWGCPVRFALAVRWWANPGTAARTFFGNVGHDVLRAVFEEFRNGAPVRYLRVPASLGGFVRLAVDKYGSAVGDEEATQTEAIMPHLIAAYVRYHERMYFRHRRLVAGVEEEFDVTREGVRERGKLDLRLRLSRSRIDLAEVIVDHKFKGMVKENTLLSTLAFNRQVHFYSRQRPHCVEFIYDIIRRPTHKSVDKAVEAINANPAHFFIPYRIPIVPADRSDFSFSLSGIYAAINAQRSAVKYRNDAMCENPYACPYLEACATGQMTGLVQNPKLFMELSDD